MSEEMVSATLNFDRGEIKRLQASIHQYKIDSDRLVNTVKLARKIIHLSRKTVAAGAMIPESALVAAETGKRGLHPWEAEKLVDWFRELAERDRKPSTFGDENARIGDAVSMSVVADDAEAVDNLVVA